MTVAEKAEIYRPSGGALALFGCRDREVLLEGPADTGKTRAALTKCHWSAIKYPGMRWGMVRKTRRSITESCQVTFDRFVNRPQVCKLWGELEYRYANGSRGVLLGLDDPEKQKSSEYDLLYVNEANELTVDDWEILLTRVTGRGATMPYTQLLADMNPTDPNFWLYRREAAGSLTVLPSRHEDNPSVTPDRLEALRALTGYRLRRLYYGERVSAEGQYFTDWNPDEHVVEPFTVPAHWTRWTSTDYGFAAPFCCLFFARDPSTRRVYVIGELYGAGLHDHQQVALITSRIREEREALAVQAGSLYARHVADPSMFAKRTEQEKPSIAEVYRQGGITLTPGSNNRKHGWSVVRGTLVRRGDQPSRLRVFRSCVNLIRTLPSMVRDPLDPEDLADEIKGAKTEDHAVDALRYGLVLEAGPPKTGTREVQVG